jgi:hypothetical protein
MSIMSVVVFLFVGLLASGCDDGGSPFALSIHPLYTKLDLDFDPILLGNWVDDQGDVSFIFEKSAELEYKLTVIEKDGQQESKAEFEAHLVQLGGSDFLDIYPRALEGSSEFYRAHLIPAHTIALLTVEPDKVNLAFLSADWLKKHIEDKSVDAAHESVAGTLILTCATEDLQHLVDLYANDGTAFPDPLDLQRAEERTQVE